MPEGPLGFPRITTLGPLVKDDENGTNNPSELLQEIMFRSHSYRNYDPREFMLLLESDELYKSDIRTELRAIEAGRFNEMLGDLHNFWFPLDNDEKETFYERNPGLVQWLEVWAKAEEQIKPSDSIGEVF